MENNKFKNYGVLIGEKSTDFHADLVSGSLPYEVRNSSGNYESWLPPGEWQKSDNGDSMSCVSFGALNAIETEELRQTGQQINYSDRWVAKMSETTRQGNYLWRVLDGIRKYGLVREESYPAPKSYTWEEYHADILEPKLSQLKAEGQEWLKKWEVNYEWVEINKQSLIKHLKHGPLIVVVPGHLVMNFYTVEQIIRVFDSYEPFKKQVPGQYPSISHGMKIVLTPKNQVDPDVLYVDLKEGDWGKEVQKLRRALTRVFPLRDDEMAEDINKDLYDNFLKEWVFRFQLANLPRNNWHFYWHFFYYRGAYVDSRTREVINQILKYRK